MGAFKDNRYMGIIGVVGMVLGGIYGIWLYSRMMFGDEGRYISEYRDMSRGEVNRMVPMIIIIGVMGLYPDYIIGDMNLGVSGCITGGEVVLGV